MTTLETPRLLSGKESYTNVLGVCNVPDSNQALITHDARAVLIQPYDGKVIRSWNCPNAKGRKITAPGIFSEEEQEFVFIQNKRTLRTLKLHNFDESETFTVKHPIHCIATHPGVEPVVIFEDGSIHFLSDILEDPKNISPCSSVPIKIVKIMSVDTAILDDGSLMIMIVCWDETNPHLLTAVMKPDEDTPHYLQSPLLNEDSSLVSTCCLRTKVGPSYAVLWSDGWLTTVKLYRTYTSLNIQADRVMQLEANKDRKLVSICPDQVVALSEGKLELIDIKFGSILQTLDVAADINRIFALDDVLVLDSPDKVHKIEFKVGALTLSQAIMKNEQANAVSMPSCPQWTQTKGFHFYDENRMKKLVDENSQAKFEILWSEFADTHDETYMEKLYHTDTVRSIFDKVGTDDGRKDFWPRETLLKIVDTGHIQGRWAHGLISQILHKKDWEFARVCIRKLNEIPESIVVQCITSVITCSEDDTNGGTDENSQSSIMREIIQLEYTTSILREELSAMPFPAVRKFLAFLTGLLEELGLSSSEPNLNQVVSWLSLLLDSHITEMVMLEDCWPSIRRLQKAVGLQHEIFQELTTIGTLMARIECKMEAPREKRMYYYVQRMHLV